VDSIDIPSANRHQPGLSNVNTVIPHGAGHPIVIGVLNVTPDSFSDGGRYADLGFRCASSGAKEKRREATREVSVS